MKYNDKTILKEFREIYSELKHINPNDELLPILSEMFEMAKKMLCKWEQHETSQSSHWYEENKHKAGNIEGE